MKPSVLPVSAVEVDSQFHAESTKVRCAAVAVTRADLGPYMHLVHQMAAKILRRLPPNVLREDLVAAGTFGLMDALRRQPRENRGPEFEWYARVRIRGAIFDELRNLDWLSRGARANASATIDGAEGASASRTVIVGFDDLPEGHGADPANDDESPLDLAERNSERIALSHAVARLPEREAQIVNLHYFQGIQFKEIAAILNVSVPRISQLHARAMKLLREIVDPAEMPSRGPSA